MADGTLGLSRLPVGAIERRGVGWWGMICVIATEGALFAYLLFSYYYYDVRFSEAWRPSELPSFRLSLPNTIHCRPVKQAVSADKGMILNTILAI
jgi:hypothetical protein